MVLLVSVAWDMSSYRVCGHCDKFLSDKVSLYLEWKVTCLLTSQIVMVHVLYERDVRRDVAKIVISEMLKQKKRED